MPNDNNFRELPILVRNQPPHGLKINVPVKGALYLDSSSGTIFQASSSGTNATWIKFSGADGADGTDGAPGAPGTTWSPEALPGFDPMAQQVLENDNGVVQWAAKV